MILSLPSSSNRDKLLLYLIFAGAKPTDKAHQAWKKEYNEILQKLTSVFQKALMVFHYNRSSEQLPSELGFGIALNMILSEFPYLGNFSVRILCEKISRGFH